jgi:hypothetical protein
VGTTRKSGDNSEYNFGPNARSIRDLIGRQKFSAHAPAPGRGRQQQCGRAAEDGTLQQTAYCNSLGGLTDDGRNHGLSCPRDVLLVFVPAIKQETTQTVMDDQGHALLDRIHPRTSPRRIISIRIHEEPAAPLATCSTLAISGRILPRRPIHPQLLHRTIQLRPARAGVSAAWRPRRMPE